MPQACGGSIQLQPMFSTPGREKGTAKMIGACQGDRSSEDIKASFPGQSGEEGPESCRDLCYCLGFSRTRFSHPGLLQDVGSKSSCGPFTWVLMPAPYVSWASPEDAPPQSPILNLLCTYTALPLAIILRYSTWQPAQHCPGRDGEAGKGPLPSL